MRFRGRPRRDRSEDVTDAERPDSYSWADGCGGRNINCRLHPPLKAVFCGLLLDSSALACLLANLAEKLAAFSAIFEQNFEH